MTSTSPDISAAESVYERVFNSVEALAISNGDIHQRLVVAGGILVPLRAIDFPDHLSERFKRIIYAMTSRAAVAGEGNLISTIHSLDEEACVKISKEVVSILREIQAIRS